MAQVDYGSPSAAPPSDTGYFTPGHAKLDPMDVNTSQTAVSPVNASPPPQTVSPQSMGAPMPGPYHEMPSQYQAHEMPSGQYGGQHGGQYGR